MRNNDNITFIDAKGVSHNARVQSFREHRDAGSNLVDVEPLVTLNYGDPKTGEPQIEIDVHHFEHPAKQESNPNLPSYALRAWKYDNEEHLKVPADHPLNDPYNAQPLRNEVGNIIPKRRPIYESHIAAHLESNGLPGATDLDPVAAEEDIRRATARRVAIIGADAGPLLAHESAQYLEIGHPLHPETIAFPFNCQSCGDGVIRVSSHQGGKEWAVDGSAEHKCTPEGITAYRESLNPKEEKVAEVDEIAVAVAPPKTGSLNDQFPVLSVIYEYGEPETYAGVKVQLPSGHSHVFVARGFSLDIQDAEQYAKVNGFQAWFNDPSVGEFIADRTVAEAVAEVTEHTKPETADPDVIAELEKAPPAPQEPHQAVEGDQQATS